MLGASLAAPFDRRSIIALLLAPVCGFVFFTLIAMIGQGAWSMFDASQPSSTGIGDLFGASLLIIVFGIQSAIMRGALCMLIIGAPLYWFHQRRRWVSFGSFFLTAFPFALLCSILLSGGSGLVYPFWVMSIFQYFTIGSAFYGWLFIWFYRRPDLNVPKPPPA